ncbi:MAG: xanthine dehydrogenase family protein molybdopterin-binding subunit [Chloroflexi bacterium]|nr:xanthine dehydrogenase family protein molybdopterin-binding subunit [Chloroflexota bacterium]
MIERQVSVVMSIVGERVVRVDAAEKATGRAKFIDDMKFPGMLHASVLRSPYAHAKILSIDKSEAEAVPGVYAVCTHEDVPGKNRHHVVTDDQPFFAEDVARHYGEAIAAVAAETRELAEYAVTKIKVEYEELPAALGLENALLDEAPYVGGEENIFRRYKIRKGDVDKGFDESDIVIEHKFVTPYQEHAYLETNGALAVPGSVGDMTVYGTMQCPFYVLHAVSDVLGLPQNMVRIIQAATGGGFGGKEDVPSLVAAIAAVLACKAGRPVKYILSREEDLICMSKRHPAIVRIKMGAKKTGELTAIEADYKVNAGAYVTLSTIVLWRGTVHVAGPYRCPNVKVDAAAVATNMVPCGAYRGFGTPQVIFAHESMMDELAFRLGMDPLEIRKINALCVGDETSTGQVITEEMGMGLMETIERASEESGWAEKRKKYSNQEGETRKGIGMSTFLYGVGLGAGGNYMARAGAHIQVYDDASVLLAVGTAEMGQGMKTVLSQIAAEELGCPLENVSIIMTDTSHVPDSGPTVASRSTVVSGNALRDAAMKIKAGLYAAVSKKKGVPPEVMESRDGAIYNRENGKMLMTFGEAVNAATGTRKHLAAQGWYISPNTDFNEEDGHGNIYFTYTWVTQVAEVEVDMRTGQVTVEHLTCAHDIGRAINPTLMEGQIQGGSSQGMGYGTMEEILYDKKGRMLTTSLSTYMIPTIQDMPDVTPIIVEHPYKEGPYGAKGVGETPLMGIAPAVTNAIRSATGVPIREIPAKPERVLKSLEGEEIL